MTGMTDAQVDAIWRTTLKEEGCQYLGPNQDRWPYTPCGGKVIEGKSYCGDHYWLMYKKGTAIAGKRKEKEIDKEIAELKRQQEIEEIENA
jgi:hypothetical protein